MEFLNSEDVLLAAKVIGFLLVSTPIAVSSVLYATSKLCGEKFFDWEELKNSVHATTGAAPSIGLGVAIALKAQVIYSSIEDIFPENKLLSWAYFPLSIALYLLAVDFIFFVAHWAAHTPLLYNSVHAYHHQFRPATCASAVAMTAIDLFLGGTCSVVIPVFFVPMSFTAWYISMSLYLVHVAWIHQLTANISQTPHKFFYGVRHHQIHHQYGAKATNYGLFTTIWDRVFGTFQEDIPSWSIGIGAIKKGASAAVAPAQYVAPPRRNTARKSLFAKHSTPIVA